MATKGALAGAKFDEVFLWVKDFPKMRNFYHDTLGLAIAYENPRFAEFRTGSAHIALHAGRRSVRATDDNWFMGFASATSTRPYERSGPAA